MSIHQCPNWFFRMLKLNVFDFSAWQYWIQIWKLLRQKRFLGFHSKNLFNYHYLIQALFNAESFTSICFSISNFIYDFLIKKRPKIKKNITILLIKGIISRIYRVNLTGIEPFTSFRHMYSYYKMIFPTYIPTTYFVYIQPLLRHSLFRINTCLFSDVNQEGHEDIFIANDIQ